MAELTNGTLSGREMDVFQARWMRERLADLGQLEWTAHQRHREAAAEPWAEVIV